MHFTEQQQKLLGLTPEKQRILDVLAVESSVNVSRVAKAASIPRTSASFLLRQLGERGLVERIKIGNHLEWRMREGRALAKILKDLAGRCFSKNNFFDSLQGASFAAQYAQGKTEMLAVIDTFFKKNGGKRIFLIQSAHSAEFAAKELKQEMFRDFVFSLHIFIKKFKVVSEVIAPESILKIIGTLSKEERESHFGRPIITYLVPDFVLHFDSDIMLAGKQVALLNYKEMSALTMEGESISAIFMSLFELLKMNSRKINLDEFIRSSKEE